MQLLTPTATQNGIGAVASGAPAGIETHAPFRLPPSKREHGAGDTSLGERDDFRRDTSAEASTHHDEAASTVNSSRATDPEASETSGRVSDATLVDGALPAPPTVDVRACGSPRRGHGGGGACETADACTSPCFRRGDGVSGVPAALIAAAPPIGKVRVRTASARRGWALPRSVRGLRTCTPGLCVHTPGPSAAVVPRYMAPTESSAARQTSAHRHVAKTKAPHTPGPSAAVVPRYMAPTESSAARQTSAHRHVAKTKAPWR
jgi:hypothetical protein